AIQLDASFLRLDESNDHVERRRLARSIGAEQPDDLALLQPERHIVHHPAAAVGLDEAERFENAAGSLEPRPPGGRMMSPSWTRRGSTVLDRCARTSSRLSRPASLSASPPVSR